MLTRDIQRNVLLTADMGRAFLRADIVADSARIVAEILLLNIGDGEYCFGEVGLARVVLHHIASVVLRQLQEGRKTPCDNVQRVF